MIPINYFSHDQFALHGSNWVQKIIQQGAISLWDTEHYSIIHAYAGKTHSCAENCSIYSFKFYFFRNQFMHEGINWYCHCSEGNQYLVL